MTKPYEFRNPDGTLRLDELLGAAHVAHYTRILGSSDEEFRAMQLGYLTGTEEAPVSAPAWAARVGTLTEAGWVTREGSGPVEASACQELAVQPGICWDVCGYYRRLGVHWRATRRQIRLAYLAKDPAQQDERLFYAMSQLLDEPLRRAYDLMPLGGLFMGDREVRERIEHLAAMAASAHNAKAFFDDEFTDQGQILKKWGFDKGLTEEEARGRVTSDPFRHGTSSDELGASRTAWERGWSWYRLEPAGGPEDEDLPPVAALERWQAMVASALSRLGLGHAQFGVGIWPGHGSRVLRVSNETCIVFLGKGGRTEGMASRAAREYVARYPQAQRIHRRTKEES